MVIFRYSVLEARASICNIGGLMNRALSKFVNLAFVAMLVACTSGGNSGGDQSNGSAGGSPAVSFASPSQNSTITPGDVTVTFATSNFTVGAEAQPHARFFLDGDSTPYEFFNGPTSEVRHASSTGLPVEWQGLNKFRILNVPSGFHILQLSLTDAAGDELDNPESKTAIFLAVGVPPATVPTIIPASPLDGSVLPPGVVHITYRFEPPDWITGWSAHAPVHR